MSDQTNNQLSTVLYGLSQSVPEDASEDEIAQKLKQLEAILENRKNTVITYGMNHPANGLDGLMYAVRLDYRNVKVKCGCIELLIKYGSDINRHAWGSAPPLFYAKESSVIETLLKHGADPKFVAFTYKNTDDYGVTVIEYFLRNHVARPDFHNVCDYKEIFEDAAKSIELLLQYGAPTNTIKGKRSNGESSLMCLCGLKRFLLATTLQRIGLSKVEAEPIMDCYLPCLDKFLERAFDMLVKAGADVNFEDSQEDSPATVCTSSKLLKKLIEEGSYILQKNRNWKTLLDNIMDTMSADSLYHIFCQDEYEMIDGFIKQAVRFGVSSSHTKSYETALTNAVKHGCADIIKRLAEAGTDINCRDEASGKTPLFYYFSYMLNLQLSANMKVLSLMRDLGADFSAADNNGNTPLHVLANQFVCSPASLRSECCFEETLDAFVKFGADIDAVNNSGYTPAAILIKGSGKNELSELMPLLSKMIGYGADMYKGGEISAVALIPSAKYKTALKRMSEQKRCSDLVLDGMIEAFER